MRGLGYKSSRQLMKLWQGQHITPRALTPISTAQWCRYSSTTSNVSPPGTTGVDIEAIRAEMLARKPQIHSDVMFPNNSDLLNTALSEFLPKLLPDEGSAEPDPSQYNLYRDLNNHEHPTIPPAHHLVYFPLSLRGSDLCPDGTDPYHSPLDTPFTRRMWAGGSIQGFSNMILDGKPAVCIESNVDVNVRGPAGAEKIFVEVLREYINRGSRSYSDLVDLRSASIGSVVRGQRGFGIKGITERRTLVFMREFNNEEKRTNLEQEQRTVKALRKPDYSVELTPTPTLLFRYSALSYNAHRIHLDRSYCREVEGYRDLLVHGPLSLTLMLSVLQSRLSQEEYPEFIEDINYRHLAPLYVGQPMRICIARLNPQATKKGEENGSDRAAETRKRRDLKVKNKWDVWVENQDGSLCVKGTAATVKYQIPRR
ncbi:hypothetical protein F4825DRAFT_464922 [Nemania diffusa]|nr:hypothetical protein F4825DRAFT_464922 [Nemania diffusa]